MKGERMKRQVPAPVAPGKLLVTVEEAADMLSLGRTKVYEMVLRKELRSVKEGRARRIPVSALIEHAER
jgi:excisionase family DNA binding protein